MSNYLTIAQQPPNGVHTMLGRIGSYDEALLVHSKRVAMYTRAICTVLQVTDETANAIYIAALLHDVGKLELPKAVLMKTEALTAQEYDLVKTHTVKTKSILSCMDFTGAYQAVPTIAAAHHECIDGSGYPYGQRELPLGSRIIAVADCYEAATAKRPYQLPLTTTQAFARLLEGINTKFDGGAVMALGIVLGITWH